MKLLLSLIFFSAVVSACPAENAVPADALHALYENSEVLNYVCVENPNCSKDEFVKGLEVKELNLGSDPRAKQPALMVEPVRKGRQYFSAVFFRTSIGLRMVFSPDLTLSGLKVLPAVKNRLYVLRGTERNSNVSWKDTDYGYDHKNKQYMPITTRCFQDEGGKAVAVKCPANT